MCSVTVQLHLPPPTSHSCQKLFLVVQSTDVHRSSTLNPTAPSESPTRPHVSTCPLVLDLPLTSGPSTITSASLVPQKRPSIAVEEASAPSTSKRVLLTQERDHASSSASRPLLAQAEPGSAKSASFATSGAGAGGGVGQTRLLWRGRVLNEHNKPLHGAFLLNYLHRTSKLIP